jgi:hypothetical protein
VSYRRAPLAAWLAPEYPRASLEQARQLRSGLAPAAIARRADPASTLTAAEAHAWLSESPDVAPLAWATRHLLRGQHVVRSWTVLGWLRRVLATPAERAALQRDRTVRGPGGQTARVRLVDRIDEIQDCDLARGARTGVVAAFEAAAERWGSAYLARLATDHRVLRDPPPWRLGARVRVLITAADLVREGADMHHCVGGYAHAVSTGQSVILSIRCRAHRSTVEVSRDGCIRQHKGAGNVPPDSVCVAILESLKRRNGWQHG